MKTTNLSPTRARWYDLSTPTCAALCIFLLLLIALIVGRVRSMPEAAAVPTPALDPIIIIATPRIEPVPPTPTPDQAVYVELAALRARVAELEAAPPPQPEVVYVSAPAPAVATPEASYQITSEPPTPALQTLAIDTDEEPLSPALLREAQDR